MCSTFGQRLAVVSVFLFLVITPTARAQTDKPSGASAGGMATTDKPSGASAGGMATTDKPSGASAGSMATATTIVAGATIVVALIAAAGGFGGVVYTQRTTAKVKRNDERNTLNQRLLTLRASLRAELTQLIEIMEGEIEFSKEAQFTWVPVRDYFETYRQNKDLIGILDKGEVEFLTATMRILEERMGYIARKSAMRNKNGIPAASQADILPNLGAPIGQNIRIDFENDADRADLRSDLKPIRQAAREARKAINKNLPETLPKLTRPPKREPAAARNS